MSDSIFGALYLRREREGMGRALGRCKRYTLLPRTYAQW